MEKPTEEFWRAAMDGAMVVGPRLFSTARSGTVVWSVRPDISDWQPAPDCGVIELTEVSGHPHTDQPKPSPE
jgi:hypothetical protein